MASVKVWTRTARAAFPQAKIVRLSFEWWARDGAEDYGMWTLTLFDVPGLKQPCDQFQGEHPQVCIDKAKWRINYVKPVTEDGEVSE